MPGWWDCDWNSRIKLTFDNSGQTENLTDFPVLVALNNGRIDYALTQDAGEDIRFVDANGVTVLKYEIEDWNESGDSYVWVKVPQIDGSSNSDHVWLYYNNSLAVYEQTPADEQAVWNNGYVGVWHLNEDQAGIGNADLYQDSTSNNFDGDDQVSATGQNGQIAGGQEFDGTDDYIDLGTTTIVDGTDTFTFSVWVNIDTLPGLNEHYGIYSRYPGVDNGSFRLMVGEWSAANDSRLNIASNDGIWHDIYANTQTSVGTWTYLAAVYDGVDTVQFYFDGNPDGASSYTEPSVTAGSGQYIGAGDPGIFRMDGFIDELRLSNTIRSADWIAAQHLSMTDTFINYSAEEPATGYCPATATPTPTATVTPTPTAT